MSILLSRRSAWIIASLVFIAAPFTATAFASTEVAKVNGNVITWQDVEAAAGGMNEAQRASFLKDIGARRQVLSGLIDQEVVADEAEKDKLDQDPEFKEAMARARRKFLVDRMIAKGVGSKLTDAAAKKFYEEHKDSFNTDRVEVQHILVDSEERARELMKEAKQPGADFQALAEKYSKDPSAKNNRGDIGVIGHDAPFVAAFKSAAFNAQAGEIVGPVRTDYGYHIIKVVRKQVGRALGYDEVELQVKQMLQAALIHDYILKLRSQAKISVDDKTLQKM